MDHNGVLTITIHTNSQFHTELVGEKIGRNLTPGDKVLLYGQLGAGKTALTRGIARGWGSTIAATSPTFSLINRYENPGKVYFLYHVDAYRLSGVPDAISTGIEDIINDTDCAVIEWPEKIVTLLSQDYVRTEIITITPDERMIIFSGPDQTIRRLLPDY